MTSVGAQDAPASAGPSLVLHHAWASTCSQKVRLALAEKGLSYESRVVNLRRFEHLEPAFLEVNPDGLVPVLVHDGFLLKESSVINEYLDEVFPSPPLRPADPQGRARVGMWSRFIDDVTSPAIKKPSFQTNMRPYLLTLPAHQVESAARRMPSRATADRWRQAALGGLSPEELAQADADLRRTLGRAETALGRTQWLAGDEFSLADVNLAPFVHRLSALPGYRLEAEWPRTADWHARLQTRPAWALARFVEQIGAAAGTGDGTGVAGMRPPA